MGVLFFNLTLSLSEGINISSRDLFSSSLLDGLNLEKFSPKFTFKIGFMLFDAFIKDKMPSVNGLTVDKYLNILIELSPPRIIEQISVR